MSANETRNQAAELNRFHWLATFSSSSCIGIQEITLNHYGFPLHPDAWIAAEKAVRGINGQHCSLIAMTPMSGPGVVKMRGS